ncbi:hypothetical protein H8356DRAFT_1277556 [Neocallimastix lanati (nom. inval.)]|nr:hypothetical protein H8356DRAFT_1277556 [Neocallimastix sp. JGI-2020a]
MFIPNKESKYSNVYSSPSKKDNQEESKNYFEQIHSKVSIKYDSYSVKYEPMSYTPKTEIKSHKASINSTHSNDNKTELQSMDNRTEINSSSSLYSPTQKILTIEQRFELIIMMAYVEMFITILLSIVVFVFNIINIIINRNSELSFVQIIINSLLTNDYVTIQNSRFFGNFISCSIVFSVYYIYTIFLMCRKDNICKWSYFISIPKPKCLIHSSYTCNCAARKVEIYNEDEIQSIDEYIAFYNEYFSFKQIISNVVKIIFSKFKL